MWLDPLVVQVGVGGKIPGWILFYKAVRRGNKNIHAKKHCVGHERSKRGRIIDNGVSIPTSRVGDIREIAELFKVVDFEITKDNDFRDLGKFALNPAV